MSVSMSKMKNYFLSLVIFVVIGLVLGYRTFPSVWKFFFKDRTPDKFISINKMGVLTYHNVCIEVSKYPTTRTIRFKNSEKTFTETMKIVIYDKTFNGSMKDRLKLSVSGSANSIWNEWEVSVKNSDIPPEYKFHKNQAAFFISPTCPGNFHHFWEDEYRVLHSVVSAANRLHSSTKNQMLYRVPWDLEPDDLSCYNVKTYEQFLFYLNFEPVHDAFIYMEPKTCFEHGVFGLADFSGTKRDASSYVLEKLDFHYDDCPPNRVTIIQRTNRRILNIHNLVNITRNEGFPDVQVIYLEKLTIEEQIRTIACSTILVGVQGAGLQWAVFMRPGSTLVEIAWPSKHWNFYFNNYITPYNIFHRGVLANHLRINWPAYQNNVRGGKVVPAEERRVLLDEKPKSPDLDNIWKWADPIVEEKHYMFALRSHTYANSVKNHR